MGLIKLDNKDQLKNYIHCGLLENRVLIKKAVDNKTINEESIIFVDSNQFLILVKAGFVIDFTMDEGFYSYSISSEPIMLKDEYGKRLYEYNKKQIIPNDGEIVAYFISTNKIGGNKFGTTNPISYYDNNLGINLDLRFYGVYTVRITNPVLFYYNYKNVIKDKLIYDDKINNEFLNDFVSNLPLSFEELSKKNINYELLSDYSKEIAKKLNQILKQKWSVKGINVVDLSIASITLTEESLDKITEAQNNLNSKSNLENSNQQEAKSEKIDQVQENTESIENKDKLNVLNKISGVNVLNSSNLKPDRDINYYNNIVNKQLDDKNDVVNDLNTKNNIDSNNDLKIFNTLNKENIHNEYNSVINHNETVREMNNQIDNKNSDNKLTKDNIINSYINSYNDLSVQKSKIENINIVNDINEQKINQDSSNVNSDLESIDDFVCPNCHAIMDDDSDYCQCCGTRKNGVVKHEDITCPVCFYKNVPSSKFCNHCGAKLQ